MKIEKILTELSCDNCCRKMDDNSNCGNIRIPFSDRGTNKIGFVKIELRYPNSMFPDKILKDICPKCAIMILKNAIKEIKKNYNV